MISSASDSSGDESRRQAVRALEESFKELVTSLRRTYAEAAELTSPGMLPGTYKVLSTISGGGPITQTALADRLAADKGMISRQVSQLEALGLIARTTDAEDGRVRLIQMTALGQARLALARQPFEDTLGRSLEGWPVETITSLASLLHALVSGVAPDPSASSEPVSRAR